MSLAMSVAEREAFLADLHVAVLGITDPGHGPLTVPVWYSYEPGGLVTVNTYRHSRKRQLLEPGARVSLCTQNEQPPYRYVTVEGPVVAIEDPGDEAVRRALAERYLGVELGALYLEATADSAADEVTLRIQPERWWTVDYQKQYD